MKYNGNKLWLFGLLSLSIGFTSCDNMSGEKNKDNMETVKEVLDLSAIDTNTRAQDDFFQYANGKWMDETEIPASKTGWGSFYEVRDQALSNMKEILDSCLTLEGVEEGTVAQQVRDLYASALDSVAIEKVGLEPLKDQLEMIDEIEDEVGVLRFVVQRYLNGDRTLFSFYVSPDDKNSNLQRAQFMQGGLGLPNNEYYLKDDEKSKEIRADYKDYIAETLILSIEDNAAKNSADAIVELETKLAKVSKSPVERRNPEANYNLMSVDELNAKAPNLRWEPLLSGLGVNEDTLLVGQPEFYVGLSHEIKNTPISTWKKYLSFHLVNDYASWLSDEYASLHFDFYNRNLNGQEEPEERWKRASSLVNNSLGDALGELYVKKFFPPKAKDYMMHLVEDLQDAYAEKIQENEWMSDETKEKALEKLGTFVLKIGYPDKWKDYSSIEIGPHSLVENMRNIGAWRFERNVKKLGRPVDKSEWFMTPPTVNAYYNPSFNEIVFPAGILQPPFYFQNGDDAVNYGGIGFVIGHEITHGFDDQGSQFDKEGNLNNWWTEEDRAEYERITKKVVDLYNSYTVEDDVHVNGELTLGENMADIGGLAIAYAAFKKTEQGQSDEKIDGLTPDQRFFMSCAQVWRIKTASKRMLWRINNDPHSPEMYRVNGPLSNMKSFYEAFGVKEGDGMYRSDEERIEIW